MADGVLADERSPAVVSWCETCVRSDGTADPLNDEGVVAATIDAMGAFDFVTLTVSTFVVSLKVVGELKDIETCSLAIARAREICQ